MIGSLYDVIKKTAIVATEGKAVVLAHALVITYMRSPAAVYFGCCTLACAFSAQFVKGIIRIPRPNGALKKSYGMPSTHSSAAACMAVLIVLACYRLSLHPFFASFVPSPEHEQKFRTLVPMIQIPWTALNGAVRVWKGHHSVEQVVAGFLFGTLYAIGCFSAFVWVAGI